MPANEYQFITKWRLPGSCEQVSELLDEAAVLRRVWPSLYSKASVIERGDEHGIGRTLRVETRGHLPYTLHWSFKVVESRRPYGYTIEAWGDMVGTGIWTFEPDGEATRVTYDWRVRTEKPLLKWLSPVLKPVFKANHDKVMAAGEAGLRAELERRRAASSTPPHCSH
jgi:hypothetical protein